MAILEQRGFLPRYCLPVHVLLNSHVNKVISMGLEFRVNCTVGLFRYLTVFIW